MRWSKTIGLMLGSLLVAQTISMPTYARKTPNNSPLSIEQEVQVKKANHLAKSGKAAKAKVLYQAALDKATNAKQCIAIAQATEKYGFSLMDIRRTCLQKGLTLADTRDDSFQIALLARQFQYYEITKAAIDSLIAHATTNEDLFSLASRSQQLALNDVSHMAMEKAGNQAKTVADALLFAKQCKLLNMDDLVRKIIKDLIDDQSDSQALCSLLPQFEPFLMSDLNRYLLRKAVYDVKSIPDCKAVFEAAKRYGQPDIVNLAAYKGRKMILLQQQAEAAAAEAAEAAEASKTDEQKKTELAEQEQKAADDLAKQNNNYNNGPGF